MFSGVKLSLELPQKNSVRRNAKIFFFITYGNCLYLFTGLTSAGGGDVKLIVPVPYEINEKLIFSLNPQAANLSITFPKS